MLCMMPVAVLTIVLGLALLIIAAGLFLRASRNSDASGTSDTSGTSGVSRTAGSSDAAAPAPVAGRWSQSESVSEPQSGLMQPLPDEDPVPVRESVPDKNAAPGPDPASDVAAEPLPDNDPEPTAAVAPTSTPAPAPEPTGHTSLAGRRARRQWAAAHGFEYMREDRYLTPEWPVSLLRLISPTRSDPAARDLVSGFVDGHQVHIADVAGTTLVALRRSESSPVDVHFTTVAAMPAGMRHSELCDCPPYTGYSTDNRALDRMLDGRVTGTLRDLAPYASDVVFSGAWLVARLSGRAEAEVWERMLPQLALLGDAARVLPPRVTSTELEMLSADPTRPRPASGARVDLTGASSSPASSGEDRSGRGDGGAAAQSPAARGHLRAVPDAPKTDPASGTAEQEETREPGQPGQTGATQETGEPTEKPGQEPDSGGAAHVNRPETPVDFPTRSEARNFGDTSDMADTGADLWNPDETQEGIPVVGGDEPVQRTGRGSHAGDPEGESPRIVRGYSEATIFADGEDGDGRETGGIPELSTPRGRHRAPDARHADATGDDDDGDEIVDPEIIDPDD